MIELLMLMQASWDYTKDLPPMRRDPVVTKMVLDLNKFGVLSQRQMAKCVSLSPPSIAAIFRRNGIKAHKGQRGALEPSGIDVLLALARTQIQHGRIDIDLLGFAVQRVGDPGLISLLTGIPHSLALEARHHDINYAHPGLRSSPIAELRRSATTGTRRV